MPLTLRSKIGYNRLTDWKTKLDVERWGPFRTQTQIRISCVQTQIRRFSIGVHVKGQAVHNKISKDNSSQWSVTLDIFVYKKSWSFLSGCLRIAPYVCTYFWVSIWYKYHGENRFSNKNKYKYKNSLFKNQTRRIMTHYGCVFSVGAVCVFSVGAHTVKWLLLWANIACSRNVRSPTLMNIYKYVTGKHQHFCSNMA